MKIICSEHNGLIEVMDTDIIDAFKNPLKEKVVYCPVCRERVLIHDVLLEPVLSRPGFFINRKHK